MAELKYQSGFGNEFATEAVKGALPEGQNAPQKSALGLYTEQLSGTAFTAPRATNRRTWTYRIRPSVTHKPFSEIPGGLGLFHSGPFTEVPSPPNQMRWNPIPMPEKKTDFVDGIVTMGGSGDPAMQIGVGVHLYAANAPMQGRYFYNADGEMMIVPQQGRLGIHTELGILDVKPGEIGVIPRGIKIRVVMEGPSRGYICENYGLPFRLPELGAIGANGLANPRDFLAPVAAYEDEDGDFRIVGKFLGRMWEAEIDHSPLDVVAWHGNYAPYKYDLARFNCINTVSFDHPDPSIYTVMTSPSLMPGTANVDFAIFPPRWVVAEHTFRPPWFHRNMMNEFMGLVFGEYDAKAEGFLPGGASLHNCMSGHGPDAETWEKASNAELKPVKLDNTLAFMWETGLPVRPTKFALETKILQHEYFECWQGLKKHFKGPGK
ncbi:MAG TPA: homogentisate 1,2-dioxygenase [Acidobacteriaceae bacterium]|nr:homogentisate 1,2-dioxygenase [Acidobacteriaceae bacterium]